LKKYRRINVIIDFRTDVLLIVDFQNDFVTGSLAVPEAEDLIPIINKYIKIFEKVVLSRDKHKRNHPSFASQGGPWPDHCVDDTFGARVHSDVLKAMGAKRLFICGLATSAFEETDMALLSFIRGITPVINKGYDEEALSAFEETDMAFVLKAMGAKRLFICGLATDYCVKATVLDAIKEFDGEVFLLADAIKAVNINENDGIKAIKEMVDEGAILITSGDLED